MGRPLQGIAVRGYPAVVGRNRIGRIQVLLDGTVSLGIDGECRGEGIEKAEALFLIADIPEIQVLRIIKGLLLIGYE